MAVAVKPSNSLLNIRSGIKSIKDSFSGLRKNAGNLNDVVLKKTKVKRESIVRNAILSQRRQEQERRKNKEDLLEASTIGGAVKRQAKAVASSTKGFLGRIMDFLATLLVGWLLTNLPSIITMAQELIARIQRLYTIVTGFFDNTIKLFRGFGSLLSAVGKNILTFDFTDSKGRVESSLTDLGGTFEDMQKQFDEGFKLLTTSLGEGVVSGEDAQPFGTQYENESMQQQPSGGGFSGSGVSKGAQIAKRLQKDLGLKDYQAAAVVGNLLNESSQINPAQIQNGGSGLLKVDGKTGYGWAQWTFPARQRELYQLAQSMGVDPSKQPLTDEINYAMLVRELPRYDSGGRFRSSRNIEEASNWLLEQYFRPADRGPREQKERIGDAKKVLQGIGTQPITAQPSPAPVQPSTSFAPVTGTTGASMGNKPLSVPYSPFKPGSGAQLTSGKGLRWGRMHKGYDIAAKTGTPLYAYFPGKVTHIGLDGTASSAGYGNWVVWKDDIYGAYHFFGHMRDRPAVRVGQVISQGTLMGYVGSTGNSTGPHLHWEISNNPPASNGQFTSYEDPGSWLRKHPLKSSGPGVITTPTPAQITPSGTQQRRQASQQLAQQQAGPSIIIIEEEPPAQQPQGSVGGGGAMMIPIVINPLNSFITKKLLLDLAYT